MRDGCACRVCVQKGSDCCGSFVSHELYTGLYEGCEGGSMRCHACWMCETDIRA